jgi:hypothetical protein
VGQRHGALHAHGRGIAHRRDFAPRARRGAHAGREVHGGGAVVPRSDPPGRRLRGRIRAARRGECPPG